MSLPEFGGMDTGFNWYHDADPSEYDLVVSNSEGGLERLRELGARRAEAVFWGADPEFFAPREVRQGDGRVLLRLRRQVPARLDADAGRRPFAGARRTSTSRSAGATSRGTSGTRRMTGDVPFNAFARAISAARVNLCITRRSHATVYASSCVPAVRARFCRRGDRREPVRRHRPVVRARRGDPHRRGCSSRRSTPIAICSPIRLQAEEMGRRARERVLDEHTYRHRARRLLELVGLAVVA